MLLSVTLVVVVVTKAEHERDSVLILSIMHYYSGNIRYLICSSRSYFKWHIYILQFSLSDRNQEECVGRGMWHVWETGVYTGFWCRDLREKDHLEDRG